MCSGRVFNINAIEAKKVEGHKVVLAMDTYRDECACFTIHIACIGDHCKSGKWTVIWD